MSIVKRDAGETVEIKEIGNGFLVIFRGFNKDGGWVNNTLYFERLAEAFEGVADHFSLPTI